MELNQRGFTGFPVLESCQEGVDDYELLIEVSQI
jgi:hypothetical protein